jgi:hypothetical protein
MNIQTEPDATEGRRWGPLLSDVADLRAES